MGVLRAEWCSGEDRASTAVRDVRVLPIGEEPSESGITLDEAEARHTDFVEIFARATSTDLADLERFALPGVQAKVSAAMIAAPMRAGRGPAIMKLNPPAGYPRLVENEDFFLRMAAACGLAVPVHRLIHDRHGRAALLIARFDRVVEDGASRRLPQEDACQILGAYPAAKYRLKTEDIATAIAGVVELGDGSRPLALRRLFEVVAFSYLIGNGDLHAKNLSARMRLDGTWEMTPAYDLLSTQPYLQWRDPMALNFFGRANRLTLEDLRPSG